MGPEETLFPFSELSWQGLLPLLTPTAGRAGAFEDVPTLPSAPQPGGLSLTSYWSKRPKIHLQVELTQHRHRVY